MVPKMANSNNPLIRHFRQPAIYLNLPSKGQYYPPGTLEMPANGELPVLPMTAVDEITSRTPDALFNGSAVVDIIKSCVPSIKDPWVLPSTDLNPILVAIRLASYGHKMEVGSTCPACNHDHEFEVDLRYVMDSFVPVDYSTPLVIGDLTLRFVPLTYTQLNQNSKFQFEDQKLMQAISTADLSEEEKMKMLGDNFRKITQATIRTISQGIQSIQTPDGVVTEQEYIEEFLKNCDKSVFNRIRDHALNLKQASEIKPLGIECVNCHHQYQQEFSIDMTNFFESNS